MKLDKQKWQTDFEKQLDIAEKPQLSKVRRFYKSEYNKGINSFIAEGQTNFQLLFNENDFLKIYRDLYSDIGIRFANWYAKGFDRYIKKGINPNQFVDQWQNSFASLGSAVGAQRVTLVSGTAKKTLIDLTQKLLRDPEFMVLGTIEKGRILRNQFNKYSAYQSRRLVQTEATNAANFATMESATTIFPGAQMMKEWIASFDDRTRSTHAEAGASEPIPYNDAFMVGGSLLMYPGDPSGPAAEVVNCRCSVAPFPKQGAQTVGELSGFNFGLAGAESTGFGLTDVVSFITASTIKEAEEFLIKNNIAKKVNYSNITLEQANEVNRVLSKIHKGKMLDSIDFDDIIMNNEFIKGVYKYNDNTILLRSDLKIKLSKRQLERNSINFYKNKLKEAKEYLKFDPNNKEAIRQVKVLQRRVNNWARETTGETLEDVLIHEYGHKLDYNNLKSIDQYTRTGYLSNTTTAFEKAFANNAKSISNKYFNGNNNNFKEWIRTNISEYATVNKKELFAEAYVMKIRGEELPKWLDDLILEVLENAK
ncbi:hypothetical protein [uncultured Polaribacter sp.]|uniref:hypothetical protein n=1 Tax=uncultured Polaribacter sp. TaxID=174711 RepID=UPI00259B0AB2|nr:hypothetical protein [uncultured Polaribacter sp.]